MDFATIIDGADRFVAYVEELTSVIGHADRALPLRDYCAGLLTAEGRKSVEPMAAVTAPAHVSVQHQKLLHFVGEGRWSDELRQVPTAPPRRERPPYTERSQSHPNESRRPEPCRRKSAVIHVRPAGHSNRR